MPERMAKDVLGQDAALHYRGPFFVMIVGRPKQADSHIYVFGDGCTKQEAYASAEAHYRRDRNLPTSVTVQANKAFECATYAEAEAFIERLVRVMAEHQESADGTTEG